MSGTKAVRPGRGPHRIGARLRRVWAATAALALAVVMLAVPSAPAWAVDHGPGWETDSGFVGSRWIDGAQVYCIDLGRLEPESGTQFDGTVTALDSHTGEALSGQALAELNYVLGRWGTTSDPNTAAAVQTVVWGLADPQTVATRGGDEYVLARVPDAQRDAVRALVAAMRAEAGANAVVSPSASVRVTMGGQRDGTVSVSSTPSSLTGTITLSGARFADGSSSARLGNGTVAINGTPATGVPAYQVAVTGSWDGFRYGARVDLWSTPGYQRMIRAAVASPLTLTAQDVSAPIPMDFQPTIGTQVSARYVQVGDRFVDQVQVGVSANSWIVVNGQPVRLVARGVLYGPFTSAPTPAASAPAEAPVVGSETLSLTGPGSYTSAGTLRATRSGFYVWVWSILKADQGANSQYLRDGAVDRFGQTPETQAVPFQPVLTSRVDTRWADPGEMVGDTVDVSAANGDWLQANGQYVPVTFEGTAYQVPGTRPPDTCRSGPVPTVMAADAQSQGTVVGRWTLTATGPGPYTAQPIALTQPGFVTWVWQVVKADQPSAWRDYIADDWTDAYGLADETTSVRWPAHIDSLVREYNIAPGGRVFDTITISGMPDDHGDFTGDGCWGPDVDEVSHVVYGPFDDDATLADDLDLSAAPVVARLTTPARNGSYELGWSDDDAIVVDQPGYYVMVSQFDGDDRVQPYRSSPADVTERFYVPATPPGSVPPQVVTRAQPDTEVGKPFTDTALVIGEVPDGATLVFTASGPAGADAAPVCADPFFTSDPMPVPGSGVYTSPPITVSEPGRIFWTASLHGADGAALAGGSCGAAGETTTARPATPPTSPPPTPPVTPPVETPPHTPPAEVPPASPPHLAQTGAEVGPLVIAAVLVSLAGVGLVAMRRTRSRTRREPQ